MSNPLLIACGFKNAIPEVDFEPGMGLVLCLISKLIKEKAHCVDVHKLAKLAGEQQN